MHRLEKEKQADLLASQDLDVTPLRTLCLALGPYRNLTTLTASLLFLHPNCQVLNHGAMRILGDPQLDFLRDHRRETVDRFLRYAIWISTKGGRGKKGGSIVHSHAFDEKHKLGRLYREQFGDKLIKEEIHSLFWKESLRTAHYIRNHDIDLVALLEQEPRLRFLLPVRHPLDCAISNRRTGHAKLFGLGNDASVEDVLEAVLEEIRWFLFWREQYPARFFYYLENDFSEITARRLAEFLLIEPDAGWIRVVQEAFDIDKHYDYPPQLIDHYAATVNGKFAAYPEFREQLLVFIKSP